MDLWDACKNCTNGVCDAKSKFWHCGISGRNINVVLDCGYKLKTAEKASIREDAPPDDAFPDMVSHPPHYTAGRIECIDAIAAALTAEEFRGFCKGNALKYIWREQHKGQSEDLKKARWYLDRLIDTQGGENV